MNAKQLEILMDEKFNSIDEKLGRILEQTTKTNGRVNSLWDWRERMKGIWIAIMVIGSLVSFGGGILVTILMTGHD